MKKKPPKSKDIFVSLLNIKKVTILTLETRGNLQAFIALGNGLEQSVELIHTFLNTPE